MKSFKEWIGESKKESGRPVFDGILGRVDTPAKLIEYFEKNLGDDFLEFSRESPMGDKIAREFSPRGFVNQKKYRSFMGSRSGYPYYYYTIGNGTSPLAIRTGDESTWWIGKNTLDTIDPNWSIDSILADF